MPRKKNLRNGRRFIMIADDVKWLHVEASSRCNAWCPLCPRNIDGYELHPNTVEQDLDISILKKTVDSLPNLYAIQFCGNHGDPIAAKDFINMIDIVKSRVKKIQIHTNGSLRNAEWWKLLASKLEGVEHDVWFGIDGLENVHEIYRQGTDWNKIITNAKAFIDSGGYATWQFIPFEHNEHQIKDCLRLSQQLKFKKFKLIKSTRTPSATVKNYKTGNLYLISSPIKINNVASAITGQKKIVNQKDCMHLNQPSIYLDVEGSYSYCCYYMSNNNIKNKLKFDSMNDLFYNNVNLSNRLCINCCGT